MRPGTVTPRRHYAGFPAFAARATREGVIALANRRDVAWVTLDAVRRPLETEPQPAQRLIRSSDANARGFDGEGQTIAIIDTGVDYTIPAMGGGGFPNAKVVAGADLGDDDDDPMDCLGHGTAVAGVAAGPLGVAPGARLAVLKVAGTLTCETADDSDILAAIDWVLAHHEEFDIAAVNLSFGSTPLDGLDHGFCDAQLPQYVSAVDALNAAGVAFTSSAGNEAVTNALSAPACLSAALSAGAVYSDNHSSVGWGDAGNELCIDRSVGSRLGGLLLQLGERARPVRPGGLLPGRGGRRRRGVPWNVRIRSRSRGGRGAPAPGAARPGAVRHGEPPARDGPARGR